MSAEREVYLEAKVRAPRANNLMRPAPAPGPYMDDTADTRPPRLAPLLLLGVLAWLAIDRPGHLGGESAPAYRLVTALVSVAVVGYVVWRFHGIIPAAVAVALLRLIDIDPPS